MEEWTILIVDENPAARLALDQCLTTDYQVIQAGSAREALHRLEEQEVDVIISELRMADLTGLDLFMRSRVTQPEAIRILIADDTSFKDMVRVINEAAVYQFVPRPWHPDQLRLLVRRALESRNCNVRIIAASNRPLKEMAEQGLFRKDLYYRLRGVDLTLPPLRERVEDISVLAEYLVRKYAESIGRNRQ
jgi:DNA-binding NtrC family response regulator